MKAFDPITIVIPLRIDSKERNENLDASLEYLLKDQHFKVIILEADCEKRYTLKPSASTIQHIFIEDTDPIFHRTKYLNTLLRLANTETVGIWDSDVIVPHEQIHIAAELCFKKLTMCYPYDGRFCAVSPQISQLYKSNHNVNILTSHNTEHWLMHGRHSVGGAFVVNRKKYMASGGENEHFYGWGPEDTERRERILSLDLEVGWVPGYLYHLNHPRGRNSNFASIDNGIKNLKEYLRVCQMTKTELQSYVASWPWTMISADQ